MYRWFPVQIHYKGKELMVKNTLKTSFGKWISSINMKKLSQQVDILNQDYYTKKLTTEAYLKIMLFAQLHETESLHAISDALLDEDFQQALGFQSISASQLSRKNNELDPSLLSTIFFGFNSSNSWNGPKSY